MSPATTETALDVVRPTALPTQVRGPRLGLPTQEEITALLQYGSVIVKSGLAPAHVKTPEAALVIMRQGHQLGIDEFTAMQNMFVVGGKPAIMASLMHSLIQRDHGGDAIQIIETSPTRCEIRCKRRDSSHLTTVTYTIEEAHKAGLKDGTWAKYPTDMLFARCVSRAARQVFRDTTMGLYTPEEIGGSYIEVQGEVIDTATGELPRDEQPRAIGRLDRLHAIGESRGLDHDALHRIAMLKRGTGFGGTNFTDVMLRDFESMIEQAADTELSLWQTDWSKALQDAERAGIDALQATGALMKEAGVSRQSHPGLYTAYSAALERLKQLPLATPGADETVDADFTELPGMPSDGDRYTA